MDQIITDQLPEPQEHWLRFTAEPPAPPVGEGVGGKDVVVVSGYKYYTDTVLTGSTESDSKANHYECHIYVGPKWRDLDGVSPVVTVSGFSHYNSDDAEDTGYGVDLCKWSWEMPQDPSEGRRIMLIVFLHVRGGTDLSIRGFAYHLVARGSLMLGQTQDFEDHKQL